MSEEKFSKCEEGKKKNVSVEFRVFGKKELKEKVPVEEKSKWFGVEILLSSWSLIGLYVNLQVRVMGKKNENFQSVSDGCLKLRLRFAEDDKVKRNVGDFISLVGRHVDWKFNHMG